MKTILNRYESASSQDVNYVKSSVVFSANTRLEDKLLVCNSLGVKEAVKPGKYLGMPMYVGRNKGEVFGFLIDRVKQKLQGWMNKDLSKAGKITLLKSVA